MSRSFLIILVFSFSLQSCLYLYHEPKITVSLDAYVIDDIENFNSKSIFVDPGPSYEDLSLLPFKHKLEKALLRQGFILAEERDKARFVMEFDVFVGDTKSHSQRGIRSAPAGYENQAVINEDGDVETVRVWQGNRPESYTYESFTYEKTLALKVRDQESKKAIWQTLASIDNEQKTYAPFADILVYAAMSHFMRESPNHPTKTDYNKSDQDMIKASLR